ncbi:CLUMA_CG017930, isoform A [Clunio marinus]|uniref:CLUMA_CG017930, isoform A n=1 Tax=Clunio marinus TaxID=568069 RepID=A0A1J1IXK2_9DIPT|nr:CLUMA_CG017930, isoform A [Clunio marinus]
MSYMCVIGELFGEKNKCLCLFKHHCLVVMSMQVNIGNMIYERNANDTLEAFCIKRDGHLTDINQFKFTAAAFIPKMVVG